MEFILAKCKTKAAYSAKLKKQAKLDLNKIKKKFEVVLETPILLVIEVKNIEIVVHGFGELLFKKCDDENFMQKTAESIYKIGLE